MKLLKDLWQDETGAVVSAELVLLGTLGLVGAGVGAAAVGDSLEAEWEETSLSIRSLDQSFHIRGFSGCGAWTAGSCYVQPPVEESRAQLRRRIERERAAAAERSGQATPHVDERDSRTPDARRPRDDERRRERRRRMREREIERRNRDHTERWDGEDVRQRRERNAAPPASRQDSGTPLDPAVDGEF